MHKNDCTLLESFVRILCTPSQTVSLVLPPQVSSIASRLHDEKCSPPRSAENKQSKTPQNQKELVVHLNSNGNCHKRLVRHHAFYTDCGSHRHLSTLLQLSHHNFDTKIATSSHRDKETSGKSLFSHPVQSDSRYFQYEQCDISMVRVP